MARDDWRRGARQNPGARGARRDSRYSQRGSRYDRYGKRSREDDEYEEEQPYYEAPRKGKMSHEQISFIVLGVIAAFIVIFLIFSMAGQSVGPTTATFRDEFGYTGRKAEEYKEDARELEASKLLGDARAYDQANPYEDKEDVAARYREVSDKYPGTKAAQDAEKKYKEVMDRRK